MALPDTKDTRQAMIDTCIWMNTQGLNQGASGNISVRVERGLLITPSGISYDVLSPDMIVTLPVEGPPSEDLGTRPSTEWPFHQRLHQTRPDMPVVLHAHPPHCSALAVQRRGIPACHYMIAIFGGANVPLADYAVFGGDELAAHVSDALQNRHGCLMANHGASVLGETIARARWRLEELETLARTFLLSHIGGQPHILSEAEIEEVSARLANYGPK